MRLPQSLTYLAAAAVLLACGEDDLSKTKPARTRDADGIIKLYGNRRQGDWMLKGNVILVEAAVVTEVAKNGRTVIVNGRTTLDPIPIRVEFSESEKRSVRLVPGDLIVFKGRCKGMNTAIRFTSCILISIAHQLPQQ
jgi:hypothetical protein